MTASKFRDAAGVERARSLAMGCGYSRVYWSSACTHSRDIPPERLTCMLDALEAINKAEAAFIRAAHRELNSRGTGEE